MNPKSCTRIVLVALLAACSETEATPQESTTVDAGSAPVVPPSPDEPDAMIAPQEPDVLAVPEAAAVCNRVPLANVYGCESADRITAPFHGVARERITVYLDSWPIHPSMWRLADNGHTIVLQHCAGTMMLSFSLDCRTTEEDCHLTASGCP